MSAPKTALSDFEERMRRGHAKAGHRRSQNIRRRPIQEVRGALHDACIQMNAFARHNPDRPDIQVLAHVVARLERYVGEVPSTRSDLLRLLRGLESCALDDRLPFDGTGPAAEYGEPHMHVHVTHDGLRRLKDALDDRIRAGLLEPAPPPPRDPAGVIDFAAARARVRFARDEE